LDYLVFPYENREIFKKALGHGPIFREYYKDTNGEWGWVLCPFCQEKFVDYMKTALFVAVDEGQTELVKLLLKSKADVGVKDECAKRSLCEQAGQSSLAKG
jgi:hypothetical protein